jgi:hypothetical protein
MSQPDPLTVCDKCGGSMVAVQADTNPGIARCSSCGHEVHFCFDPAIPVREVGEDTSDGVLWLEHPGPNPIRVASAIRPLTGLTSQQALTLVRSGEIAIVRRNHWRIWELNNLQETLNALGAKTTIQRGA